MQPHSHVLSPEARRNPTAYFAHLRENTPVFYSDPPGMWLITRYEDVVDMVRRPEDFSSIAMRRQAPGEDERGPKNVITTDPPHHTRLRSILQRRFTNRALNETQTAYRIGQRFVDRAFRKQSSI